MCIFKDLEIYFVKPMATLFLGLDFFLLNYY